MSIHSLRFYKNPNENEFPEAWIFNNEDTKKYLIGKKFRFDSTKINVIFGPNGSGKTTILRTIAGWANVKDGFTTLQGPLDIDIPWSFEKKAEYDFVKDHLKKKCVKNPSKISWDGNPIYYHNFAHRLSYGYCQLGQMVGGILKDFKDEMTWRMCEFTTNAGRKAMFMVDRLTEYMQNELCYKDLLVGERHVNESWKNAYKHQLDYFSSYPAFDKKSKITLLLDEIDTSFDITAIWNLYYRILPEIVKKYGCQLILVTHSPIILSDKIFNNPIYNIISIDEQYTKECRDGIKNIFENSTTEL